MTIFLRLLEDKEKDSSLTVVCNAVRSDTSEPRIFEINHALFDSVPGKPFAYWVSENIRQMFQKYPSLEGEKSTARKGPFTGDDFRFLRLYWETLSEKWVLIAKGGAYSPFYADVYVSVNYANDGYELDQTPGNGLANVDLFFKEGLFQTQRSNTLAPHLTPPGCLFNANGTQIFVSRANILSLLSLLNSSSSDFLIKLVLGRFGYSLYLAGPIGKIPVPEIDYKNRDILTSFAHRSWSLKRTLDTVEETSHAFYLPFSLRARLGDYDLSAIESELADIQAKIDDIAFDLYGFRDTDRSESLMSLSAAAEESRNTAEDISNSSEVVYQTDGLLSWAAGVVFGRFDWRLATGERETPPKPDPFDPLPAKSPGMLPDGTEPFHAHSGILTDDQGHPNDLARLIEEVLARVDAPVPADVRRWLQRDFFPYHLKQYSKSRRKAPIYWPISTNSSSYTLWLYYPSLTSQTLYSAVNDFIEGPTGKLQQVEHDLVALRSKGSARSAADEKNFEKLLTLEAELTELRETLLEIAPTYRPNHDDGVQISAAPLWRLFRDKSWQKILKDTWAKLEKGDYDWAHLAMAYWPDRVREKCKTDKSLAIAHDLEILYKEPEVAPGAKRGRTKTGGTT